MDTTIAIISELISSIALVGVVITLLLESRQLRTSQLQASRVLQAELIRLAMDYPDIASVMGLGISSEGYRKYAFLSLLLDSREMSYSLETMSTRAIQCQARILFNSDYSRTWWVAVREPWNDAATTKNEREFFALIDGEFVAATVHEPGRGPDGESGEPRADSEISALGCPRSGSRLAHLWLRTDAYSRLLPRP
ncbi:DUF6082 family protein [Streptomyces sp. NPDC050743]|uniref:DUF6082 family protein n=1 Tax=Streptomyces sp. NPDC050743 TaxID=3365634 RepID=UPI00379B673D